MTNADQIAREIASKALEPTDHPRRYQSLVANIRIALTEAHTAGFNEAKGRAVEVAEKATMVVAANSVGETMSAPIKHRERIARQIEALQEGKDG